MNKQANRKSETTLAPAAMNLAAGGRAISTWLRRAAWTARRCGACRNNRKRAGRCSCQPISLCWAPAVCSYGRPGALLDGADRRDARHRAQLSILSAARDHALDSLGEPAMQSRSVGSVAFFCCRRRNSSVKFINSSALPPRRSRRGGSAAPEGRVYCCFAHGLSVETGTSPPEAME
jgi:hypothetical protein